MKRLPEMKLLKGQTENISMTELRARPGDVIAQVQMGKTFDIYKTGKIVATLSPPELNGVEIAKLVRGQK